MKPTLKELQASVARELALRRAVYPKSNRMREDQKAHELACMVEIHRLLGVLGHARANLTASPDMRALAENVARCSRLRPTPEEILPHLVDMVLGAIRGDDKENAEDVK